MPSASSDALYLNYLADLANVLLRDAKAQKRATPDVWLWGELDDAVAKYAKAAEAMCNGPRNRVGVQEARMGELEDRAFSLLLALGVQKGRVSTSLEESRSFLSRIILVRQDEKSLEDLVWDERAALWEKN